MYVMAANIISNISEESSLGLAPINSDMFIQGGLGDINLLYIILENPVLMIIYRITVRRVLQLE